MEPCSAQKADRGGGGTNGFGAHIRALEQQKVAVVLPHHDGRKSLGKAQLKRFALGDIGDVPAVGPIR